VKDFQQLWSAAKTILRNTDLGGQKVRLLGLGISNAGETLGRKSIQLQLDLF